MNPHQFTPPVPQVKDSAARGLLVVLLIFTLINTVMIAYLFSVVYRAVEALRELSGSF